MWWCIWLDNYVDNMEHQQSLHHIYYINTVYVNVIRFPTVRCALLLVKKYFDLVLFFILICI